MFKFNSSHHTLFLLTPVHLLDGNCDHFELDYTALN